MPLYTWISANWFELIQTLGIVGSLCLTFTGFRLDTRSHRVSNQIEITREHREIWSELFKRPELARISQKEVDLEGCPIKPEEELFIGLLILHLNSAFHAIQDGLYLEPEGMRDDVRQFFSRPMAIAVWNKLKPLQDKRFVKFVESSRKGAARATSSSVA